MAEQWRYEPGGERFRIPLRVVGLSVCGLSLLVILSFCLLTALYAPLPSADSPREASRGPAIAPLIERPGRQWQVYREEQQALLSSSAWQDREQQRARVPLAVAMSDFLEAQAGDSRSGAPKGRGREAN